MFKELPDIHKEIAKAMLKIRHMVKEGHERDLFESQQEAKVAELVDLWLTFQKEEATASIFCERPEPV